MSNLHCGKFIPIPEDLGLDQPRFDTSHGDVGFGQLHTQSFRQGFNAMFCAGIGAAGGTDFCFDNAGGVKKNGAKLNSRGIGYSLPDIVLAVFFSRGEITEL
jgi:hypothetical protein